MKGYAVVLAVALGTTLLCTPIVRYFVVRCGAVVRQMARNPARCAIGKAGSEERTGGGEGGQRLESPAGALQPPAEIGVLGCPHALVEAAHLFERGAPHEQVGGDGAGEVRMR